MLSQIALDWADLRVVALTVQSVAALHNLRIITLHNALDPIHVVLIRIKLMVLELLLQIKDAILL